MNKTTAERFADDLINIINYYIAEWDISYLEILGAIEIAKLEAQKTNQIFGQEDDA